MRLSHAPFEKNVFIDTDDVSKLEIEAGGEEFSWEKAGSIWRPAVQDAAALPQKASGPSCDDFLSLLGNLSYREKIHAGILDDPAQGKTSPLILLKFISPLYKP